MKLKKKTKKKQKQKTGKQYKDLIIWKKKKQAQIQAEVDYVLLRCLIFKQRVCIKIS